MAARLPLFPLGLVLVPGQLLPLHVFEPRYRVLVEDLLGQPESARELGVLAIRAGREVGEDGVLALHEVGTVARLRTADRHPDGRYDVLTVGVDRFRVVGFEHDKPYLVGRVERLSDAPGDPADAAVLAPAARAALAQYVRALAAAGSGRDALPELPEDPRSLGYLVTAAARVDLADRQALLEAPDDAARLRAALDLLRRETRLMHALSAVPAPELARTPLSPN
ncbi:MAG: LON peptidase substrate-binding domain-containing protein [Actinomycetes bacterium]